MHEVTALSFEFPPKFLFLYSLREFKGIAVNFALKLHYIQH